MSDLTICSVVCNDNQVHLFDIMIKSVLKFTKFEPKFIICDNGNNNLKKYELLPNFTIIKNNSRCRGSLQHGEGLNKIIPMSKTKYTAIIESDCVILSDKWYSISNEYKMVGAKKSAETYHICFLLFVTDILKNLDFLPGTEKNRGNRSYKINEDVGWKIKDNISEDRVCKLRFIDCKTGQGKIFDNGFQSDEFWLEECPIVAHFGRGSNLLGKANRKNFKSHGSQLKDWKTIIERILL